MGAHNALSARLVQQAGFDAVWASGFEIAATRAQPDANILSMTECLEIAAELAEAVEVPVLADCDSGFGGVGNVAHMVRSYEARGIAGVCIEDKLFPKLNSFVDGHQDLAEIGDFAARIAAATEARRDPDFVVVARIEALIAGAGMEEALRRADVYEQANADALVIHSKRDVPDEVYEFAERYAGTLPVIVIPTTYPNVTVDELAARGIDAVIYANQSLRAAVIAMRNVMARIRSAGSTAAVEAEIAPLPELFDLQRMGELLSRQERYDELAAEYQSLARAGGASNGYGRPAVDEALRRRIGDQQRTQADRSSV
jgi:phosphoenolpyruvate phosphomutase